MKRIIALCVLIVEVACTDSPQTSTITQPPTRPSILTGEFSILYNGGSVSLYLPLMGVQGSPSTKDGLCNNKPFWLMVNQDRSFGTVCGYQITKDLATANKADWQTADSMNPTFTIKKVNGPAYVVHAATREWFRLSCPLAGHMKIEIGLANGSGGYNITTLTDGQVTVDGGGFNYHISNDACLAPDAYVFVFKASKPHWSNAPSVTRWQEPLFGEYVLNSVGDYIQGSIGMAPGFCGNFNDSSTFVSDEAWEIWDSVPSYGGSQTTGQFIGGKYFTDGCRKEYNKDVVANTNTYDSAALSFGVPHEKIVIRLDATHFYELGFSFALNHTGGLIFAGDLLHSNPTTHCLPDGTVKWSLSDWDGSEIDTVVTASSILADGGAFRFAKEGYKPQCTPGT